MGTFFSFKSLFITVLAATGIWFTFTKIFQQNQSIKSSYNAYTEKKYQEVINDLKYLADTFLLDDEGVQLNIAHASYHINGFSGPNGINSLNNSDSAYLSKTQAALYEYTQVWESDDIIASRCYHQSGMVVFKSRIVNNKPADESKLINSALDYFKNALRKDPFNEKARYNYEILRKYKEFPEQLMGMVRKLVDMRYYMQAYQLLGPYAQNDSRFQSYQEYAKRLGDIVNIETQNE